MGLRPAQKVLYCQAVGYPSKYFRDGEPFVELGWWIETIEGDIWLAGGATVKLPSKR